MKPNDRNVSRRLRRERAAGVLLILLGILLSVVGFSVRLTHLEQDESFHFAWQMFAALAPVLCLSYGIPLLLRARRLLRSPFYQNQARIEQEDERTQLIDRLAWRAMGKLLAAALEIAMLVSLALVRLEVFGTCFALYLFWGVGMWVLRRWYGKRL